eukprot:GILJ01008136.1.p1 GENE.GILJ01008136.1~~GILJ01008136.1.p1  ORF type:complete len:316 (-),score=81.37 GILJ01008136.1:140-1087(-)
MAAKKPLTDLQYLEKLHDVSTRTYIEQAKFFLNAYIGEFSGRFGVVLDFVTKFARFDPRNTEGNELGEFDAHRFLEHMEEANTVVELRKKLSKIDLDTNNKLALIEYLVFKFDKTVKELIDLPQNSNAELLAAIDEFNRHVASRVAREKRMDELRALSNEAGVKGKTAKAELAQLEAQDQLDQRRQEITAAAKTRRLQKEPGAGGAERELEEIARKKAEEEAAKRAASRAALAAKAAQWNQKTATKVIAEVQQTNVSLRSVVLKVTENPELERQRILGAVRKPQALKTTRKPSEDLSNTLKQAFIEDKQEKTPEE